MADPLSAGIGAVGGLLTGLFGASARKKEQQRELAAKEKEAAMGRKDDALEKLSTGQQNAFQGLISSFGKALL